MVSTMEDMNPEEANLIAVNLLGKIRNWITWHPNSGQKPPHGFEDEQDILKAINNTIETIYHSLEHNEHLR